MCLSREVTSNQFLFNVFTVTAVSDHTMEETELTNLLSPRATTADKSLGLRPIGDLGQSNF